MMCICLLTNKRPMGFDALIENKLVHLLKFQKLHIYIYSSFYLRGQN